MGKTAEFIFLLTGKDPTRKDQLPKAIKQLIRDSSGDVFAEHEVSRLIANVLGQDRERIDSPDDVTTRVVKRNVESLDRLWLLAQKAVARKCLDEAYRDILPTRQELFVAICDAIRVDIPKP